jgi:pyrimidine-nucleoside phosphorylase
MYTPELINKKRNGKELSQAEIEFLVNGFVSGEVPDYQMAAFLMATCFTGMSKDECVTFTMAMANSGEMADLSPIKGFKVDKHSSGGVGDTTSLVLAPLVASAGAVVAKMTGRELGHTGGTVDKLESIPGINLELGKDDFIRIANQVGVSLVAQSASLAPADKKLYALRNVTATVESIPLIAASIMSKKLAGGADGIVLDVKTGSGAFMQKYEDSLELAKTMVDIGEGAGRKMVALISSMEQPLGLAIGNALEVKEAIDTLKGEGPQDLLELVLELGGNMVLLAGVAKSLDQAKDRLKACIANGAGLKKFAQFIKAHGGDPEVVRNISILPRAKAVQELAVPRSGYVHAMNAMELGMASKLLGAGRFIKDDRPDLSVGIELKCKVGDRVDKGQPLAVLHTDGDTERIGQAREKVLGAFSITVEPADPPRLLMARVTSKGVEELA